MEAAGGFFTKDDVVTFRVVEAFGLRHNGVLEDPKKDEWFAQLLRNDLQVHKRVDMPYRPPDEPEEQALLEPTTGDQTERSTLVDMAYRLPERTIALRIGRSFPSGHVVASAADDENAFFLLTRVASPDPA